MHNRLDPGHCGVDPPAARQIAGRELDAFAGLVTAPTEHPHGTAGIPQEWRGEAPERAGAAG